MAWRENILALWEARKDISLEELRACLIEIGLTVSVAGLTAALGALVEACEDCGHWRISFKTCWNRHCPKCHGAAARIWLAECEADLLPAGSFHVVFTVPTEVVAIALHNKA